MPRHRNLNLKKFLDSIPDHLIKEYFERKKEQGIPQSPESFDTDSVNAFIDKIGNEDLKSGILEDFTHVNDVCERVMGFLVRAVKLYGVETTGEEERQHLAMDLFLHHKEAFDYAYDYYCLYNSSSKMSQHNITAKDFRITPPTIERFRRKVGDFYAESAKGRECVVRHYDEENQTVIVIIRGSYRRTMVVWEGGTTKTIHFRPANEDILQYNKNTSVLSIKAPYQKDKESYIDAFTQTILGDESQAQRLDRDQTYSLKPLQDGSFSFAGNDAITSITLVEVKLAMRGITKPALVIKSDNVLETLEKDLPDISLDSGELVHAKFKFRLEVDGKSKRVTFEITPPNATDLVRKRYADIVGQYLKENGVKLV